MQDMQKLKASLFFLNKVAKTGEKSEVLTTPDSTLEYLSSDKFQKIFGRREKFLNRLKPRKEMQNMQTLKASLFFLNKAAKIG
jgi:hypothetical protein